MSIVSDNWKLALDHPEVITEYLANEVAIGHKVGLFTQPPFSDFVISLMGIITKKHSFPVKYRIIHDLSWPPQDSINGHIDQMPSDASMAPLMMQWLSSSNMG